MDRIHSFAKVALAAIGIFFSLRMAPQILTIFVVAKMRPSEMSYWVAAAWAAALGLCIVILLYIFVYKREQLAKRIASEEELTEPNSPVQWLGVAFRLVCVTAGLYFLFTVGWNISFTLIRYFLSKPEATIEGYKVLYTAKFLSIELIVRWLIMLAIGIYLVCGAPHFVRWHVKKALELCKKQSEINR